MKMSKLSSIDLVKKYRKTTVVNGVSLEIKSGEVVGLLGPNGAGKTTTFYMIIGFISPQGGKVHIGETEITKYPMYKGPKWVLAIWLRKHRYLENYQ